MFLYRITSSLCWTFSSFTAVQALLDAWYPLWQWVFQPAIGVLMLGAVSPHCHGLAVLCLQFSLIPFLSLRLQLLPSCCCAVDLRSGGLGAEKLILDMSMYRGQRAPVLL